MTDEVIIQKAKDPNAIAALYGEVIDYFNANVNFTAWAHGFYPTRQTALDGIAAGTLYEARINGELAGAVVLNHYQPEPYRKLRFSYAENDDSEVLVIHTLAVSPKFRRRGVARALVLHADAVARELGCKAIRLDTANINAPALKLYRAVGFSEVGRIILRTDTPSIDFWHVFEKAV